VIKWSPVKGIQERLFMRFPHTRAFFASTDMKEPRKKLVGALTLVIPHLRKPEALTSALKGLGQRHVTYGVQPEHYPIVGAVLLETFADFLGERWTPAAHQAWAPADETVCAIMLEGASLSLPARAHADFRQAWGRATGMPAPASIQAGSLGSFSGEGTGGGNGRPGSTLSRSRYALEDSCLLPDS
jgi:hemoglobin-like flavoprotein